MASQNDYQLALRIPSELLTAIDAEVDRVKAERPGARVQRSDVVREALMRAFFSHPQSMSGIIKRDNAEPNTNGGDRGANGNGHRRDDSPESH